MINLNHGSGWSPTGSTLPIAEKINSLIDQALLAKNKQQPQRAYLGASRIGEPCARKLCYEAAHVEVDEGRGFDGRAMRYFHAGHVFETMLVDWLTAAGFIIKTADKNGQQFGFEIANGRIAGHIDGAIIGGPDVGLKYPGGFEAKALNNKSWTDTLKKGVKVSKPIYFAQCQLYMAYMELPWFLFTALNKDTQEIYHEYVPFDAKAAQEYSDKACDVIRAVDSDTLLPRVAASRDFFLCKWCAYQDRCWSTEN